MKDTAGVKVKSYTTRGERRGRGQRRTLEIKATEFGSMRPSVDRTSYLAAHPGDTYPGRTAREWFDYRLGIITLPRGTRLDSVEVID